jgi:hypothetical protein
MKYNPQKLLRNINNLSQNYVVLNLELNVHSLVGVKLIAVIGQSSKLKESQNK